MSASEYETKNIAEEQSGVHSDPLMEAVSPNSMEDSDTAEDIVDQKDGRIETQDLRNPVDDMDSEGEDCDSISPCATVVPSNTPVTGDSGHVSPTMESSLDSLNDGTQQLQDPFENCSINDAAVAVDENTASTLTPVSCTQLDSNSSVLSNGDVCSNLNKTEAKVAKDDKVVEKKKSRKKEDKSGEHILRALNSLQSPEDKLAALCKKFADLHEEHRAFQASFKTQQRNLTVVVREKEQLQSEHTKAMMAKSKLESLCRELQKHNKIIETESIKRAKESDEKRKEISAHFNTTISEIQSQMNDNSEKNNMLRQENENLADQLRTFMSQCEARDEHFKKLQEQHDLENKLAAAKLAQADAIVKEVEERSNKEKELMMLKFNEMTKKVQLTEAQLQLYKSKYDEFNALHTRSSETFQKYKTEMEKMSKRIKNLEKDGLQWKAKWESSSKTLLEQYEARSKTEQEKAVYAQKVQKLESLCRALQVELHRKKAVSNDTTNQENAQTSCPIKVDTPASTGPPNSPQGSSSDECSPAIIDPLSSTTVTAAASADSPPSPRMSQSPTPVSSHLPSAAVVTDTTESTEKDLTCVPGGSCADVSNDYETGDKTNKDVATFLALSTSPESLS